jgi:hypothetical protein
MKTVFSEIARSGLQTRLVYQDPDSIGRHVLHEIGWFRITVRKIGMKTWERATILKCLDDLGRNRVALGLLYLAECVQGLLTRFSRQWHFDNRQDGDLLDRADGPLCGRIESAKLKQFIAKELSADRKVRPFDTAQDRFGREEVEEIPAQAVFAAVGHLIHPTVATYLQGAQKLIPRDQSSNIQRKGRSQKGRRRRKAFEGGPDRDNRQRKLLGGKARQTGNSLISDLGILITFGQKARRAAEEDLQILHQ